MVEKEVEKLVHIEVPVEKVRASPAACPPSPGRAFEYCLIGVTLSVEDRLRAPILYPNPTPHTLRSFADWKIIWMG